MKQVPIEFNGVFFHFNHEDTHNIHVKICVSDNINSEILWECHLQGLWEDDSIRENDDLRRIWDMHNEGDFFQQTLIRHNRELHQGISYTAWFHEMILQNREALTFISNIYSTSNINWLTMGYTINPVATNVWNIQVQNNIAEYNEAEGRYRLLL
jgi:hypothetical protein